MKIGIKIKIARESQGMTQTDLANKIDMSKSYIAMIESHRTEISIKSLKKIANALNLNPSYFLDEDNDFKGITGELDHLSLKDKEFISNSNNLDWIILSRELSELGVKAKKLRKLINISMSLNDSHEE